MDKELINEEIISIEENLRMICWKVKKKGREILSEVEITPPQFNALLYLIKDGDLTIGELSQKMFLACSTVTDLLDRMERNGLVKRVKDEKDRRIVRIQVLDKGRKVKESVLLRRRLFLKEIFVDYDDEQIKSLDEDFKRLNDTMTI